MGKLSTTGVLVSIGIFFLLTGIFLSLIEIENPLTAHRTSIIGWVWEMITQ